VSASSRRVDEQGSKIWAMDILAVILGVLAFALLFALLEGIDRI
jgi:hypothetical protein